MGFSAFPLTTQVYPRFVDYVFLSSLAGIAAASSKFALDLRLLSSPVLGEMYKEPGKEKAGSSHAPWKIYNPTEAERINSIARYVASLPHIAWQNAASDILERTLDDSANRRIILPEGCLAADQMLMEYDSGLRNLRVREGAVKRNLARYGTFLNVESLMMKAVRRGANRQRFHEVVRQHAMPAFDEMTETGENTLPERLEKDTDITRYVSADEIRSMLSTEQTDAYQLGDAQGRTEQYMDEVLDPLLEKHKDRLGVHEEPEF